jgi:hypothetical protein
VTRPASLLAFNLAIAIALPFTATATIDPVNHRTILNVASPLTPSSNSVAHSIAVGPDGTLFFADHLLHVVGRLDAAGAPVILAGQPGQSGQVDGLGSDARFQDITDIAVEPSGNLLISELGKIRRMTPAGGVTTIVSSSQGPIDPECLAIDGTGSVYVCDGSTVVKLSASGTMTPVAGARGMSGYQDGIGDAARFSALGDIAFDLDGDLVVADAGNSVIRHVRLSDGAVTTVAGAAGMHGSEDGSTYNARFDHPSGVAVGSDGSIFVTDTGNSRLRRIASGQVTTSAGSAVGSIEGTGWHSAFTSPARIVALADDTLLFTDAEGLIRRAIRSLPDEASIDVGGALANVARTLAPTVQSPGASYQWSVILRPDESVATIDDSVSAVTTFTPDAPGHYAFRLRAELNDRVSISAVRLYAYCSATAPVITTATNPTCYAAPTVLSADAGYEQYEWSSGERTQTITVAPTAQLTMTVRGFKDGCWSTATAYTLRTKTAPSLDVRAGGKTYCNSATGDYLTAVAGDDTPQNYQWGYRATPGGAFVPLTGRTLDTWYVNPRDFPGEGTYAVSCLMTSSCATPLETPSVPISVSVPPTVAIQPSSAVLCPNTGVELTAEAGGSPPLSYSWRFKGVPIADAVGPTYFAREAGVYDVTVTSLTCSATANAFVQQVSAIKPRTTPSGSTSFCDGSSVTITATIANEYLWSNGATTKSITVNEPGTYSVAILDRNNCPVTSDPVIVTRIPRPIATVTASGPISFCEGGSVTLTADDGASWLWSNGATTRSITVTETGVYSVQVTNEQSCTANSDLVQVTVHARPSAEIAPSGPLTFCSGGSVTLTAAPAASYLWSNGDTSQSIEVANAGQYSVTVTDANGCAASSAPVAVAVNPRPATPIVTASGPITFCEGGSVTLTAPLSASYLWSNGATTRSIAVSTSGAYSVTVWDANGCSSTSAATNVIVTPRTTVIQQPQSITIAKNTSTTLRVTAAGTGTLSYQWFSGVVGDTSRPVGTGSTYTTARLAKGTYRYWVRVSGTCGTADSAAAVVTVR